ncbi:unnamed protein product [Spirodela intermedia]|uniref:Uncharacterized protein n=1 Tax=Spirodela intermedia TaxID=51605 RepID=A0A7I8LJW0_SPIIN|nr:unnamed protein product [Spirodela intermedia]
MGVTMGPGETALAVIPVPASSLDKILPGRRESTVDEDMVIIRPPPPRTRRLAASRQQRKVPLAFTRNI